MISQLYIGETFAMNTAQRVTVREMAIGTGGFDGAEIAFDLNDRRIIVCVVVSALALRLNYPSIGEQVVSLIRRVVSVDEEAQETKEIVSRIMHLIFAAGRSILEQVAPPGRPRSVPLSLDLHSLLFPTTLVFKLVNFSGTTSALVSNDSTKRIVMDLGKLVLVDPGEAYAPDACEGDFFGIKKNTLSLETFLPRNSLPRFSTRQVLVLDTIVKRAGYAATRVRVGGKVMFCKAWVKGEEWDYSNVEREMLCLQSLSKAQRSFPVLQMVLRIPLLRGYIQHADTGRFVGLLRQWVPGVPLKSIDVAGILAERRQKWASQIRETVDYLDFTSLLWGGANASHVIIDNRDDAWLIGFGNGMVSRGSNEEQTKTMEKQKQAIGQIMALLGFGKGC